MRRKLLAIMVVVLSVAFMAAFAQAADPAYYGPGMGGGMMGGGMPCPGCKMMGKGMMGAGMGCGCGMMGGGMMGMEHPMMHGMIEQGAAEGGVEMTPMMRMTFMRAMMKGMIRNALQDPKIKAFLDSTESLRKQLVEARFQYFEAFRNPATSADQLEKMKAGIKKLEDQINQKMMAPAP